MDRDQSVRAALAFYEKRRAAGRGSVPSLNSGEQRQTSGKHDSGADGEAERQLRLVSRLAGSRFAILQTGREVLECAGNLIEQLAALGIFQLSGAASHLDGSRPVVGRIGLHRRTDIIPTTPTFCRSLGFQRQAGREP
jgi:hypothetical protein